MKDGIFALIFKNLGYKVFALFLAVVIWSLIQGEQILEDNREVIVNVEIPKGYMIRGDVRRVILATVRGPRVLMTERTPLEAKVKVPPLKGSKYRVRVDKEDIKDWDGRLQITIHDPYLTLYIDEEGSRMVPVRWEHQGTPAEGYFIKKKLLKPAAVKLTGLKGDLLKVREVATEPVDISGLQENRSFDVSLIPPEGFTPENIGSDTVNVSVQVSEILENKRYANLPIDVTGNDYEVLTSPKVAVVTIQARPSVLKFIEPKNFQVTVDASGLKPGQYEREIKLKIPSETVLIESAPEKVILNVERRRSMR